MWSIAKWAVVLGKLIDIVGKLVTEWSRVRAEKAGADKLQKEIDAETAKRKKAADAIRDGDIPDEFLLPPDKRK